MLHNEDPAAREKVSSIVSIVRYLILRQINFEALPEGPLGKRQLQEIFHRLFDFLQPNLFMDVGAHDGAASLAIRKRSPNCIIHAFEANPQIFAKNKPRLEAEGVRSWNLAVSDACGRAIVYAPLTLSQRFIDREVIPASVRKETENTGKTSLLLRNEDATYREFDVEAVTLDSFAETHIPDWHQRTVFLLIDVEGASDRVISGAAQFLERTSVIFMETEGCPFWKEQANLSTVTARLMDAGFLPIARDREYGNKQFNILYVHENALEHLMPFLFKQETLFPLSEKQSSAASARPSSVPHQSLGQALQTEIPILIPCFDTVTYVRGMVEQLRTRGFRNIVLVDNASTYEPMRQYLKDPGTGVTVIRQPQNLGPRNVILDPLNFTLLPQFFCVTDPDLTLNPDMPLDFLAQLAALTEQHSVGKAGLALDISDPSAMRDDDFQVSGRHWKIWEWEANFWKTRLGTTASGDPVFKASIDTTFALYNKKFFDPNKPLNAVRVAGRFTCRHLPWYRDTGLPQAEEEHYRQYARYSHYLRSADSPPPASLRDDILAQSAKGDGDRP